MISKIYHPNASLPSLLLFFAYSQNPISWIYTRLRSFLFIKTSRLCRTQYLDQCHIIARQSVLLLWTGLPCRISWHALGFEYKAAGSIPAKATLEFSYFQLQFWFDRRFRPRLHVSKDVQPTDLALRYYAGQKPSKGYLPFTSQYNG